MDDVALICPCFRRNQIVKLDNGYACSHADCVCSEKKGGFHNSGKCPVLINFQDCDTLCDQSVYRMPERRYIPRLENCWARAVKKVIYGVSPITLRLCKLFIKNITRNNSVPKVLIIGSGSIGQGSEQLYASADISFVGVDIYPSESVDFIADAHYLPFLDNQFDGVWIQAVLEHVVDPSLVAAEIYRVLKRDGVVYSEAPFMQQIHEGAYDFYRFTGSAHRHVFKNFEVLDIGVVGGPATAFSWSLRYLLYSLLNSKIISLALSAPFFILGRYLDRIIGIKKSWGGASGTYILCKKSKDTARHTQIMKTYMGK